MNYKAGNLTLPLSRGDTQVCYLKYALGHIDDISHQ